VSHPSNERAIFSDSSGTIFVMLTMRSAIVTSRKRKLRELFAVATQVDPLPDHGLANPDAPAATPAEWQFLQASDILQYVSRIFDTFCFSISSPRCRDTPCFRLLRACLDRNSHLTGTISLTILFALQGQDAERSPHSCETQAVARAAQTIACRVEKGCRTSRSSFNSSHWRCKCATDSSQEADDV